MSENNKSCGRLVSVINGWKCEKCGIVKNETTELWKVQAECKGKNA